MSTHLVSAQQARHWFYTKGISVSDWAREHNFPRAAVYTVLSGKSRCSRGRGHEIAIELGMKEPAEAVGQPYLAAQQQKDHQR